MAQTGLAALDGVLLQAAGALVEAEERQAWISQQVADDARLVRWESLPEEQQKAALQDCGDIAGGVSVPLGRRMALLTGALAQMQQVLQESSSPRTDIRAALSASSSTIDQVSKLHAALQRAEGALERTDDVMELRSCTEDIALATRRHDMETAALAIQRFKGVARSLPISADDRRRVQEAENHVVETTRSNLRTALKHKGGQQGGIASGCRVLAVLGRGAEALELYLGDFRDRLRLELPNAFFGALGETRTTHPAATAAALAVAAAEPPKDTPKLALSAEETVTDASLAAAWKSWMEISGAAEAAAIRPTTVVNATSAAFACAITLVQKEASFVSITFDEAALGAGTENTPIGDSDSSNATETTAAEAATETAAAETAAATGGFLASWRAQAGSVGEGSRVLVAAAAAEVSAAVAPLLRGLASCDAVMQLVVGQGVVQSALHQSPAVAGVGLFPCTAFAVLAAEEDAASDEGGRRGCLWVDLGRRLDDAVAVAPGGRRRPGRGLDALGAALDATGLVLGRSNKFRSLLLARAERSVLTSSSVFTPTGLHKAILRSLRFVNRATAPMWGATGDLVAVHTTLERLQLEVALARVAAVEAAETCQPARTSLVEDSSWVCQKSLERAAACGDGTVVAKVARAVASAWREGLVAALAARAEALLGERGDTLPKAKAGSSGSRGGGVLGVSAAQAVSGVASSAVAAAASSLAGAVGATSGLGDGIKTTATGPSGGEHEDGDSDDDDLAETAEDVQQAVREHSWAMAETVFLAHGLGLVSRDREATAAQAERRSRAGAGTDVSAGAAGMMRAGVGSLVASLSPLPSARSLSRTAYAAGSGASSITGHTPGSYDVGGGDDSDGMSDGVALDAAGESELVARALGVADVEQWAICAVINALSDASDSAKSMASWVDEHASSTELLRQWKASDDSKVTGQEADSTPSTCVPGIAAAADALRDAGISADGRRKSALRRLCSTLLPKLRSLMISYSSHAPGMSHATNDTSGSLQQPTGPDADDDRSSHTASAFGVRVLQSMSRLLAPWKAMLETEQARIAAELVVGYVCDRMLGVIARRHLTSVSAAGLDRDCRELAEWAERWGGLPARNRTATLQEAGRVLCCETLEEAAEEWSLSGRHLTSEQLAMLIRRRTDLPGATDSARVMGVIAAASSSLSTT